MAQEVRIRQEQARLEMEKPHWSDDFQPAIVETHSIIMAVFVIGLLACCMVILAALYSERLTQAILDARHDLAQWVIAYWSGR
jgi:hypothetical protein